MQSFRNLQKQNPILEVQGKDLGSRKYVKERKGERDRKSETERKQKRLSAEGTGRLRPALGGMWKWRVDRGQAGYRARSLARVLEIDRK